MADSNETLHQVIQRGCIVLVLAFFILLPTPGAATPGNPADPERAIAADSDGDGIADDFDPDDDNDGLADDQEGASGNPGSDILDPGKDTDTDGIPNVLDPDDNDNGVTDEEDPESFPSTGGGSSNPPAPSTGGGSTNPPAEGSTSPAPRPAPNASSGQGESGALIQALPVTGSGTIGTPGLLHSLMTAAGATAALTGAILLAGQRQMKANMNR